jgi:hypothetical protein
LIILKAKQVYNLVAQTGLVAVQIGVLTIKSESVYNIIGPEARANLVLLDTAFAVFYTLVWCFVTPRVIRLQPSPERDSWIFSSVAGTGLAFASLGAGLFMMATGSATPS